MTAPFPFIYLLVLLGSLAQKICHHTWALFLTLLSFSHPQLTKSYWFYWNSLESLHFSLSSLLHADESPLWPSLTGITPFLCFFIPITLSWKSKLLAIAYKTILIFAPAISPHSSSPVNQPYVLFSFLWRHRILSLLTFLPTVSLAWSFFFL